MIEKYEKFCINKNRPSITKEEMKEYRKKYRIQYYKTDKYKNYNKKCKKEK